MPLYSLTRRALFALPPEVAHSVTFNALDGLARIRGQSGPGATLRWPVSVMGLRFPNPVGVAAGLDKDGRHIDGLGTLGFGFIEVGTVTPREQPGNARPRLYRLPRAQALINRMGFNNRGVDQLYLRLGRHRFEGIIGVNLGKNKATPEARAVEDYIKGLEVIFPRAHYVAVNVSSPNTPGLREWQTGDRLRALLDGLCEARDQLGARHGRHVPLAFKVAPDLEREDLEAFAEAVNAYPIDAVIATNTTLSRRGVEPDRLAAQAGGLSGRPLAQRALETQRVLRGRLKPQTALIASGGIMSVDDALIRLREGASLVQLYTGLIYRGPGLVGEIVRALDRPPGPRSPATRPGPGGPSPTAAP